MTDCARCGDCCDPVILPLTKKQVRERNTPSGPFILANWRRISRAEAARRRPDLEPHRPGQRYYQCAAFDPDTRLCTAHDDRPPICRRFPWYEQKPEASRLGTLTRCSFWADIPQADRPSWALPLIPKENAGG